LVFDWGFFFVNYWVYYMDPKVGNKMQNGPGCSQTGLRLVIEAHRLGASSIAAFKNTACRLLWL
jgi:hypothetical protein